MGQDISSEEVDEMFDMKKEVDIKMQVKKLIKHNELLRLELNKTEKELEQSRQHENDLAKAMIVLKGRLRKIAPDINYEPWTQIPEWNLKVLKQLKKEIWDYMPLMELGYNNENIPDVNILVLGSTGAGKSSFFNTLESIFRGRLTMKARAGTNNNSVTKKFRKFQVLSAKSQRGSRFRICDCPGLQEKNGITVQDFEAIIDGHVPDGHFLDPSVCITQETCKNYMQNPRLQDMIHCAVFVVDGSNIDELTDEILQKMKEIQDILNQKEIPQFILLSKIDKINEIFCKDLSSCFYSSDVYNAVRKVSETFGLPDYAVLPMKNITYEHGPMIGNKLGILTLSNLRRMLWAADDYLSIHINELI